MNKRKQRGEAELIGLLFVVALVICLVGLASIDHHRKHQPRHAQLVKSNHHLYIHNDDDTWWEFISNLPDIDLPKSSGSTTRLPAGTWARAAAPKEAIEEEEEATVEESEAGAPDDGASDAGSDSGDSGDSGGDGGGDGE
jgi:hypothetical protein